MILFLTIQIGFSMNPATIMTDNRLVTYIRQYDNSVNLTGYDFIEVNWVGQDKNEPHTIQFSSNSNDSIIYHFKDSWKGPKQLLLPMNLTDIDSEFNRNRH